MTQQLQEDLSLPIRSSSDTSDTSEALSEQAAESSSPESNLESSEPASSNSSPQTNIFLKVVRFLRSIAPWLWAIVIVVVVFPKVGELFIAKAFEKPLPDSTPSVTLIHPGSTPDWQQTEKLLVRVLRDAHQSAETFAAQKLDAWVDDLTERVDRSFLDWYFGYFNQKELEYKGFFAGITANMAYWLNPNSQSPEERVAEVITEEFQTEFTKRVLRPQIAQLQLERITEQTVKHYLNELNLNINQIPSKQSITKADWDFYLNEISLSVQDANGTLVSLPIKTLLGVTAYTAVKPLILPLLPVVSSKVVATLAGKAGAKIAAKSGAILAGKIGSTFLDTTVGVGILLWDIWDVNHTASIEKPILRQSLVDYLQTVSDSLLNNPETGIVTVIDSVEQKILQGIQSAKTITSNF